MKQTSKKPAAKKAAPKKAAPKKAATSGTFKVVGHADVVTQNRHFRTGRAYVLRYDDADLAGLVADGKIKEVK